MLDELTKVRIAAAAEAGYRRQQEHRMKKQGKPLKSIGYGATGKKQGRR
jgi:hypothetical protein